MAINPKTPGIHHINFRCTDMAISKDFYQNVIGLPLALETPEITAFLAGNAFIVFKKATPKHPEDSVFYPLNIGTDHVALACETEDELHRIAQGLADAGVENTGVKVDDTLNKLYIAFKDPDRIQLEFYMI